MKFKVITTNTEGDRYTEFLQSATDNGLTFDVVNGTITKGFESTDPIFDRWGNWSEGVTKGAVGCAYSHMDLYVEIAGQDENYLVCEDDARFIAGFDADEMEQKLIDNDLEMLHLSNHGFRTTQFINTHTDANITTIPEIVKYSMGWLLPNTCAYIITPACAKKVVAHARLRNPEELYCETFIDRHLMHLAKRDWIKVRGINPVAVAHAGVESEINDDDYLVVPKPTTPLEAIVPKVVTAAQFKSALGPVRFAEVESVLAAIPDEGVKFEYTQFWLNTTEFKINNPMVLAMQDPAMLGWDDETKNQIFIDASKK